MKRIALIVVLCALFAMSAAALQVSSPLLGGQNQDRNENVSAQVTITNNGTSTLTNFNVAFPGADPKYRLTANGVPSNISAGASATITVTGLVPLDFDAIDSSTLKAQAFSIATLTVTATNSASAQESASSGISMQAVNQLELKKARIDCGDKSKSLNDGDKIKGLKPGDQCTLEIEVKNNFNQNDRDNKKNGDVEFRTVNLRVESGSRNDIDIDDPDDIETLSADDTDQQSVEVQVESDASDGTVSVEISAFGDDDNGALQGERITVRLEIIRLTHDIQIRRVEISPNRVSNCEAVSVKGNVNVLNLGKRNEKDVAVEVSFPDLKYSKKVDKIELDKDDATGASFDISVPKGTKAGVLHGDVRTFFDQVALSNSGSVDLTVEDCNTQQDNTTTARTSPVQPVAQPQPVVQPQPQPGTSVAAPKKTTSSSFTSSPVYVGLLIALIVVVVAILVGLIVMLVRGKSAA